MKGIVSVTALRLVVAVVIQSRYVLRRCSICGVAGPIAISMIFLQHGVDRQKSLGVRAFLIAWLN